MAEVAIRVKNTVEGQRNVQNQAKEYKGLNDSIKTIAASMGAVAAAGYVFKQAFDMSREGASINQLETSFNRLNESTLHTPDLLRDMSDAARGTIKEADLMQGVLKLTAGTTAELSQEFAGAAPRLVEIAKAANALNPTLGDTAFLYDSISTGIKRQSPLILDNLGIVVKVGEANEKYAQQLGKSVEALTAEEKQIALLNATLEAGDTLINQVGGDVSSQTDAWDRLTVKVGEQTDSFKQNMAEGLLPWIQLVNGDYAEAIRKIEEGNIAAAEATDDYTKAVTRSEQGNRLAIASAARTSSTVEEFTQKLIDLGAITQFLTPQEKALAREWYDQEKAAIMTSAAAEQLNEQMELHERALQRASAATQETTDSTTIFEHATKSTTVAMAVFVSQMRENQDALKDQKAAALESAEGQRAIQKEIRATADALDASIQSEFASTFTAALDDTNAAYGRWVTTATAVGGLTDSQQQNFDDLTRSAESIREEINSLTGGTAGLGLSADQLNEKLQVQYDKLALVEGALGPLASQTVTYTDAQSKWIVDAEALNEQLFQQITAGTDNEIAITGAAIALGLYDEAQIEAALNAAIINEQINALAESFVNGEITAGQLQTKMQEIVDGSPYTTEIEAITDEAMGNLNKVHSKMKELDGLVSHSKVIVTTENRTSGDATGGGGEPGRAVGGPVMANQPYYVGEHGAEMFVPNTNGTIVPNGQTGAGGQINLTINVTAGNNNPNMTGRQIASVVSEELGRLT